MTILDFPSVRITPEQLLEYPDNGGMELVDGQIVEKPVSEESSAVEIYLGGKLAIYAAHTKTARVYSQGLGYRCFGHSVGDSDRIRKPDCSVIALKRVHALPVPIPGYMPIVPDLAIEVLSPNDVLSDVVAKVREYRQAGFPLVWIVEPMDQTVTVYPNPGKPFLLNADDEVRAEAALPGFVCRVADLFPPRD
jgi:Uma2 family endonuclease